MPRLECNIHNCLHTFVDKAGGCEAIEKPVSNSQKKITVQCFLFIRIQLIKYCLSPFLIKEVTNVFREFCLIFYCSLHLKSQIQERLIEIESKLTNISKQILKIIARAICIAGTRQKECAWPSGGHMVISC